MNVSFDFGGGAFSDAVPAWNAVQWDPRDFCTVSWRAHPAKPERRESVAWKRVALAALRTSLRLCACNVAHLLPEGIDPVVRHWMRTGDPASVASAVTVARTAERALRAMGAGAARAMGVVELAAMASEAQWESEWMAGSVATLADRIAHGVSQPFADHLLALALYQLRQVRFVGGVLDEEERLIDTPGAPLGAWRRVVLCSVGEDVRGELLDMGWAPEPVAEVEL